MDRIVSLVLFAPDWIADRVGDLFHAPFWKVVGGAVVVTLAVVAFSAAPASGRDRIKLVAIVGGLGLAAFDLLRTFGWGFPLG